MTPNALSLLGIASSAQLTKTTLILRLIKVKILDK